jgi:hypothetical protein
VLLRLLPLSFLNLGFPVKWHEIENNDLRQRGRAAFLLCDHHMRRKRTDHHRTYRQQYCHSAVSHAFGEWTSFAPNSPQLVLKKERKKERKKEEMKIK